MGAVGSDTEAARELRRLEALRSLNLSMASAEERFTRLTRLARRVFQVPMAAITLVDRDRVWFKSSEGTEVTELPRESSFSDAVVREGRPLVLADVPKDPRFANLPEVIGPSHVRFVAAHPLRATDGRVVGVLKVLDTAPRGWTDEDVERMRDLAQVVEHEFQFQEHHEAALALQAASERLVAILGNILDGIITMDEAGIVESFNPAAERIFGYAAAEMIGQSITRLMPEPHRSQHAGYVHRYMATGEKKIIGVGREVTGVRKDGSEFPLDLAVTELRVGERRLFTGIARDITERKRAAAANELLKERLRRGQLYANIGTWDWNIVTGELFWTERIAPLFGYPAGDLATTYENFLKSIHPEDRQAVIDAVGAALDRDAPYEIEHRVLWPDGTVRWLLERGAVIRDAQGRALQMLGVVQDIDERKRTEFALMEAREEADHANRAKSEFLSSMSHELRTPMNAILGFGQLMDLDPSLPEKHHDSVREILKAGTHLLELINEVLDLAKIESGHIDLSLEPVDLEPLVAECFGLIGTLALKGDVVLRHRGLGGKAVRGDQTRLRQVLLNLLSNAIKYNRPGGRVVVEAFAQEPERLRVMVTDTGLGIAPERMGELFQPFNRLDADSSPIEGTGIGLTITRRLVEMMGGTVDLRSELGVGTSFWIDLPAEAISAPAEPSAASAAAPHPVGEKTQQKTVLYIEDNPANLKLVAQILGRRPHVHLVTAHSPQLGLELALALMPKLILLDINLPGMDGYQVLKVLETNEGLRAIPVVAVSANAMARDIERGLAAGFAEYLTKPLDVARFYQVVDRLLGQSE